MLTEVVTGHINNLYNTTFWALIQKGGMEAPAAEKLLSVSADLLHLSLTENLTVKRGLLLPIRTRSCGPDSVSTTTTSRRYTRRAVLCLEMYVHLHRQDMLRFADAKQYELVEPSSQKTAANDIDNSAEPVQQSKTQAEKAKKLRNKAQVTVQHLDIIKDEFWDRRPWLLSNKPGKPSKAA